MMNSHSMAGWRRGLLHAAACLMFSLVAVWAASAAEPELSPEEAARRAAEIVPRLGHEDYATRERASRELVKLGFPALESLEAGIRNPDPEIRQRVRRVLTVIREVDFDRRLRDFLSDRDNSRSHGLPAWREYRDYFGDSSESRSLFVDMQRAEPDLMRALATRSEKLHSLLTDRIKELQQMQQMYGSGLTLGTVVTLIFTAEHLQPFTDEGPRSALYQFSRQESVRLALLSGPRRPLVKKLLGNWVTRADGWHVPQALMLAHDYELPEGLGLAIKSIESATGQPFERQYALAIVARFGTTEHQPLVEALLDDSTLLSAVPVDNVTIRVEIRDVALLTLLEMTRQDPAAYGYSQVRAGVNEVIHAGGRFFENDELRRRAMDKWKVWREAHPKSRT